MSQFYKEEPFPSSPSKEDYQLHHKRPSEDATSHEDVFIDGPSIHQNDKNIQEKVEIQIVGASSSESLATDEDEKPRANHGITTNNGINNSDVGGLSTTNEEIEGRKRRPSTPEIYGKKVTFGDESSGVSDSDDDGNRSKSDTQQEQEIKPTKTEFNQKENKSMKSDPIKIPERKPKAKRAVSRKKTHLTVDASDDKSKSRSGSLQNAAHTLISPISSHAFGFLMQAPMVFDQHNATTVNEDTDKSNASETPSTIGSPPEEGKRNSDPFDGENTKPFEDLATPSSPTSASDVFTFGDKNDIGRNIRDILKGLPSFEEAGKRFIVVGLGYECHRFESANNMLDHITGENQDAESFWIDCQGSTPDDVHAIQKYFGIHSLTAEDMLNNDSGEKWEVFDNYMFMIFTGQIADKVASNDYLPCHLNVLIFENCIITVHDKPIEGMDLLMNRIEKEFEIDAKHRKKLKHGKSIREKRDIIEKIRSEMMPKKDDSAESVRRRKSTTIPSPSWVFYAYLDAIIDVYIPKVDNLTRECDTLDEFTVSLNTTEKEDLLWRIALNKRRTIVLRKLLLPKQKMITYLVSSRVPLPFIDKEIQLYLRDVLDHLTYCCDRLDIARDSLHQSHTNYLTRVQIEIAQNAQKTDAFMNRLTVFASIFGPLSVLSGIWGMNIKVPGQLQNSENDNLYWFFGICSFMVILSLSLVMLLRRQLVSM